MPPFDTPATATGRISPPVAVPPDAEGDTADALTLGRRVRERRTQLGLKLEQLAAAIDRAPSQISAIENGKREPSLPV